MFGFEKEKTALFEFDIEKNIKQNPNEAQKILQKIKQKTIEIRSALQNKHVLSSKDVERLEMVLNGYAAMEKVLSKLNQSKRG